MYLRICNISLTSSALALAQSVASLGKINHTQKITPGQRDFLCCVCRWRHQFTQASEPSAAPHVAGCYTARHPLICCHPERARPLKKRWHSLSALVLTCDDALEEEEEEEGAATELLTCDKDGELVSQQTLICWDVSAWIQTDPVARVVGRRSGRSGCSVLTVTVGGNQLELDAAG